MKSIKGKELKSILEEYSDDADIELTHVFDMENANSFDIIINIDCAVLRIEKKHLMNTYPE